jgi:hypothetical protein
MLVGGQLLPPLHVDIGLLLGGLQLVSPQLLVLVGGRMMLLLVVDKRLLVVGLMRMLVLDGARPLLSVLIGIGLQLVMVVL